MSIPSEDQLPVPNSLETDWPENECVIICILKCP